MQKSEIIRIRIASDEKSAFQNAADLSGISLSAWMRERLRRAARRELQDANRKVPFLENID